MSARLRPPWGAWCRAALGAAAACALLAGGAAAQVAPDASWRTLRTEHFLVHFTPETEALARRAAAAAERAYGQLAAELPPPRGPIDLVVSDDVDFSNGYATTFPSNRIVVYANPPVDHPALRAYDDWNTLVVTHELVHVFHLDRSRGWWRAAQRVFGRSPFLFPNQYLPAWVTEGIAVYYESRLTGSGRIAGAQHRTLAGVAALGGAVPEAGALSLASSRFPGGEAAYAYGGLFVDYLARTRGDSGVAGFVEAVARQPIPFLQLDRAARRGFGVTFTRGWREWRDSLAASVAPWRTDSGGRAFAALSGPLWQAQGPRWTGDSTFVVGANTGREVPGAYRLSLDGGGRRIDRRNDATPNAVRGDGALVFAQIDFVNPYQLRSDLYVQAGGRERRLTRGARLSRPDARADGAIVAVRTDAGATHLVRVARDGGTIAPLTVPDAAVHWSEPRWSPDGTRIAAVRWESGGASQIVVLDTLGAVVRVLSGGRAVHGNPSWTRDGAVLFASDSSGRSQLYLARPEGDAAPVRLSNEAGALFHPELSPDGRSIAAVLLAADGYRIVAADAGEARASGARGDTTPPSSATSALFDRPAVPALPAVAPSEAPARAYSPWRSLRPTYWLPVLASGDAAETFVGAATSGQDVIGRHAYSAQLLVGTGTGLREYSAAYRYARLVQPVLDGGIQQTWDRSVVTDRDGARAGELRARERVAWLGATLSRPRVRTNAWANAAVEMEWNAYETDPAPLLGRLDPFFARGHRHPAARLGVGFGNTMRPLLSISPEDGVQLSATLRQRWLGDDVAPVTRSAVGVATAYRSLPFMPGFAHHVLAARVAAGWADDAATASFEAGGVSGGTLEVLPGVLVGEGARTFGVRGVPVAAQRGTRAVAGTLEYRAPIAVAGRGLAPLPVFVDRASFALFGEAASAWCPPSALGRAPCRRAGAARDWLSSAGAELDLDVALQYDVPYRFRFGVALPRPHAASGVSGGVRGFVTVGRAF